MNADQANREAAEVESLETEDWRAVLQDRLKETRLRLQRAALNLSLRPGTEELADLQATVNALTDCHGRAATTSNSGFARRRLSARPCARRRAARHYRFSCLRVRIAGSCLGSCGARAHGWGATQPTRIAVRGSGCGVNYYAGGHQLGRP